MMKLDDPSSSSIIPNEQPVPVEPITYMDSALYRAAEDGDIEPFYQYQGGLRSLVDGGRNTAVHIYSRTGECRVVKTDRIFLCFQKKRNEREFSINFVEQLVDKCPLMLLQPNANGEIPLHIAVRHGHSKIVEFLVERAKIVQHEDVEKGKSSEAVSSRLRQMLSTVDKKGNTAFHTAAGTGNVDVMRLLVKELDADFSFAGNSMGETPLYIAARRGKHLVMGEILDKCKSIKDYGGPDGTTALHAAVMCRSKPTMRKLMEARKQLIKQTDNKGQTPVHYAATLYESWAAKLLLEIDASAAYITDKERGMSPLHIAAWRGRTETMECIISHCPGCCEIVDNRGWNFFHILVAVFPAKKITRFLPGYKNKIKDLPIRNLLDQEDVNGITPSHVLRLGPAFKKFKKFHELCNIFSSLQSKESPILSSEAMQKEIQGVLEDIVNNAKVAGFPMVKYSFTRYLEEAAAEKDVPEHKTKEKARENHLLVATLVATVTFAAAFTVPGGYKSEQGTAILSRDSAFKAFLITDTLAFVSSLLAISLNFLFVLFDNSNRKSLVFWMHLADWLTLSAMIPMVVAFSTGTYAVLKSSLGFAITSCSLGLIFFPGLLIVVLYPRFFPGANPLAVKEILP